MNRLLAPVLTAVFAAVPLVARAAEDKYAITAEEHAACDADAVSLCSDVRPDEDSMIACMRAKRTQLSSGCSVVFTAGLRRRHLPL